MSLGGRHKPCRTVTHYFCTPCKSTLHKGSTTTMFLEVHASFETLPSGQGYKNKVS
jgi:hypothetical protein